MSRNTNFEFTGNCNSFIFVLQISSVANSIKGERLILLSLESFAINFYNLQIGSVSKFLISVS